MSRRAPSAPPRIDGFDYVELIGSGGFSDVFLYEQRRPRRRVAVKVLLSERTASQRAAFDAEADLMATLSTHPSIVTMYEADIAADGRPYLAMEYCPRPNLGARYRTERLTVAEVLRLSVQIAGAVETAHRAGILHRDIKPANILVTEYGHPALTDFGISSALDDVRAAEGMSIPWSPPESFQDPPVAGVATDVWALAATTYTLLAGRSPFEVPGGPNGSAELVARIERAALAPTGRDDVPPALERILATAMAKRPESRYPSVLAFARALQRVQNDLRLAVTPIDLLDDVGRAAREGGDEPDDEPGTRLRPVASIDPAGPLARVQASASASFAQAPFVPAAGQAPGQRPAAVPATPSGFEATVHRGAVPAVPDERAALPDDRAARSDERSALPDERTTLRGDAGTGQDPRSATGVEREDTRRGLRVLVGSAVAALAVGGVLWTTLHGGADDGDSAGRPGQQTQDAAQPPQDNLDTLVPPVRDLTGTVQGGEAVFTWQPPQDAAEGDRFAWAELTKTGEPRYTVVEEPTATLPLAADGQTCVRVVVERHGRFSASPQEVCVP